MKNIVKIIVSITLAFVIFIPLHIQLYYRKNNFHSAISHVTDHAISFHVHAIAGCYIRKTLKNPPTRFKDFPLLLFFLSLEPNREYPFMRKETHIWTTKKFPPAFIFHRIPSKSFCSSLMKVKLFPFSHFPKNQRSIIYPPTLSNH